MKNEFTIEADLDQDAIARMQEAASVRNALFKAVQNETVSATSAALAREARKWGKTIKGMSGNSENLEKNSQMAKTRQALFEKFRHATEANQTQSMVDFSRELRHYEKALHKKSKPLNPGIG